MVGKALVSRALLAGALPVLCCCLVAGCGGEKTYRVSGKVTFKGKPLPAGRIIFLPDGSKGNKGSEGYADIKDGAYDTANPGGKGAVAGPMTVRIEAWDPAKKVDKPEKSALGSVPSLFPPYQTTADLPNADSTKDFDVPAEAVNGPPKKTLGSK